MPGGNGARGRGETQKKQKSPGKKAKGAQTKREKRAERASELTFEKFMAGDRPDLTLGFVLTACGNSRFTVRLIDGTEPRCISLGGNLAVGRKKGGNPAVKVAIFPSTLDEKGNVMTPGSDVLTDGSAIYAVLSREETRQALRRLGERNRSPASSRGSTRRSRSSGSSSSVSASASPLEYAPGEAPEGFAWNVPNYRAKGRAGKLATRKAEHKAEKKARRAVRLAEREAAPVNRYANLERAERAVATGRPGAIGVEMVEVKVPRAPRISRWGFQSTF
jgi:hypothetical protein